MDIEGWATRKQLVRLLPISILATIAIFVLVSRGRVVNTQTTSHSVRFHAAASVSNGSSTGRSVAGTDSKLSLATPIASTHQGTSSSSSVAAPRSPKIAVCVTGGLRSHLYRRVYQPFKEYFLDGLAPASRRQVFYDVEFDHHCDSNGVNREHSAACKEAQIMNAAAVFNTYIAPLMEPTTVRNATISCKDPFLKGYACCTKKFRRQFPHDVKNQASNQAWNGMYSYLRKIRCYKTAMKHEDPNDPFDYIVVVRPDLVFFEPVISVAELEKRPHRVYVSSKESDQPFGDYIYIIPRRFASNFFSSISNMFAAQCKKNHEILWSPEFHFEEILAKFPLQVLPLAFAIVRVYGGADCERLDNEVLRKNMLYRYEQTNLSARDFCQTLVDNDYFTKENRDEPPIPMQSLLDNLNEIVY
eukprot:GILK01014865.1.p1 GENE.GILK01014865.1~~GILK01014865.1.p1  ORF type:complete len:415 (-),score=41.54 GILK01014865.1:439-1683(-)